MVEGIGGKKTPGRVLKEKLSSSIGTAEKRPNTPKRKKPEALGL